MFALGVPIALGVTLVASRFVPVFYGDGFEPVIGLITVLAFMIPVIGCSNVIGIQLLVPSGREKLLTASVAIGAGVNVVLNLGLIYFYASTGAAIASLVAEAVVTAVQFFFVRKELKITRILKISVRYILFGIVMTAVGLVAAHFAPDGIVGIAVIALPCVAIYGGLLVVTRDPVFALFKKNK